MRSNRSSARSPTRMATGLKSIVRLVSAVSTPTARSSSRACSIFLSNAKKFTSNGVVSTLTVGRENQFAGVVSDPRYRHRHDARAAWPAVSALRAGRCFDHEALRRHRPWARRSPSIFARCSAARHARRANPAKARHLRLRCRIAGLSRKPLSWSAPPTAAFLNPATLRSYWWSTTMRRRAAF